jgi:phasin family protein
MAETPTPANSGSPPKNGVTNEAFEAAKAAADATARQAKDGAKAAEVVGEKTAQATAAAAQANSDILRTHVETARSAVRTGLEAGVKSFEGMTQNWTRTLGLAAPDPELAETSARNLRAVSQASTALAKGAQDASRAWIELTQKTVRSNMEAFGQLTQVRSLPELVALQSNLVRDGLEQAIASSEEIARVSADAIREATRAIHQPQLI